MKTKAQKIIIQLNLFKNYKKYLLFQYINLKSQGNKYKKTEGQIIYETITFWILRWKKFSFILAKLQKNKSDHYNLNDFKSCENTNLKPYISC